MAFCFFATFFFLRGSQNVNTVTIKRTEITERYLGLEWKTGSWIWRQRRYCHVHASDNYDVSARNMISPYNVPQFDPF